MIERGGAHPSTNTFMFYESLCLCQNRHLCRGLYICFLVIHLARSSESMWVQPSVSTQFAYRLIKGASLISFKHWGVVAMSKDVQVTLLDKVSQTSELRNMTGVYRKQIGTNTTLDHSASTQFTASF